MVQIHFPQMILFEHFPDETDIQWNLVETRIPPYPAEKTVRDLFA